MSELQRFTTEYVDVEDRIRLSGEIAPGEAQILWLTRRLIGRLLPHLCEWLEKQHGAGNRQTDASMTNVMQGFALQAALLALVPQAPVRSEKVQCSWLVQAVDISGGNEAALRLAFRGREGERVMLTLPPQALRQWLGILHSQCSVGGWPLEACPPWLAELASGGAQSPTSLH